MTRLSRELVLDVYSMWGVWGAPEWAATGDLSSLPRRLRPFLDVAAERIAKRLGSSEPKA